VILTRSSDGAFSAASPVAVGIVVMAPVSGRLQVTER
jgi:hypothetical protein